MFAVSTSLNTSVSTSLFSHQGSHFISTEEGYWLQKLQATSRRSFLSFNFFFLKLSLGNVFDTCVPDYVDSILTLAMACYHKSATNSENSPLLPITLCCSHGASAFALIHNLPICNSEQPELQKIPVSAYGYISAGSDHRRSHTHKGQEAEHQITPKPRATPGVSSDKPVC